MAKQMSTSTPEAKPPRLYFTTFHPTRQDSFRVKRAAGGVLWSVEVTRTSAGRVEFQVELDPPDTLDSIERKVLGLVQEAERR